MQVTTYTVVNVFTTVYVVTVLSTRFCVKTRSQDGIILHMVAWLFAGIWGRARLHNLRIGYG